MSRYRKEAGKQGEEKAAGILMNKGFNIRTVNWRSPLGEIDIIAEKGDLIVFAEVKTRYGMDYGAAAEAVNKKKQQHIARTAAAYIKAEGLRGRSYRFDVLSVMPEEIEHIEDAFMVEGFTI